MPTSRSRFAPLLLPVLVLGLPGAAVGQLATVRVEENFRMEPNGTVLARLLPGTTLSVEERRENWMEVEVEGWVWMRSLLATDRAGFDLVVAPEEGENLRAGPQGAVLARLEPGTLLEEEERVPGWIRVRRRGWVWSASVEVAQAETPQGDAAAPAVPPESVPEAPDRAEESAAAPGPPAGAGEPPSGGAGGPSVVTAPAAGLPVLAAPDGDTLAGARAGTDVQVMERRGGWARVRVEGWAWLPGGGGAGEEGGAPAAAPADVTPEDVRGSPDRWVGRVVTWDLQFVSLERAERVRTDFFEGEPFLLTRIPGGRGPFVYVAVPPDRLAEVEGLTALERIRVTGRVRAGASALTGSPILDLMDLRRPGR